MQTTTHTPVIAKSNEGSNPWTRWFDPSERTLAFLLLMPTALLLSLIIVYPVLRLLWTSFQNLSLTTGVPATFAGL